MAKFPLLTGRQVIAALEKVAFRVSRQKGSHVRMVHADGRATTVPDHGQTPLGRGLMSQILRDVRMSREEFLSLL